MPATKPIAIAFELDRFVAAGDLLEVEGRWVGVRGRRFVRPSLTASVGGGSKRALARLEHKPWAPAEQSRWIAAFPWSGSVDEVDEFELAVAPDLAVVLPAPAAGRGDVRELTLQAVRPALPAPAKSKPGPPKVKPDRVERPSAGRPARSRSRTPDRSNVESQTAIDRHRQVVAERDKAIAERDHANAERDHANAERDHANAERDHANAERDHANAERDQASAERDEARRARNAAQAELKAARAARYAARAEIETATAAIRTQLEDAVTGALDQSARDAALRANATAARDAAIAKRDEALSTRSELRAAFEQLGTELVQACDQREQALVGLAHAEAELACLREDLARSRSNHGPLVGQPSPLEKSVPWPRITVYPPADARIWRARIVTIAVLIVVVVALLVIVVSR